MSVVGVVKLQASQNLERVGESSFCVFFFVTWLHYFLFFFCQFCIDEDICHAPSHHCCRSWSAAKLCQLQLMNLIWFVLHAIITNVFGSFFVVVVSGWCCCTVHRAGKTSLAKALAQKLSIRLQQRYPLSKARWNQYPQSVQQMVQWKCQVGEDDDHYFVESSWLFFSKCNDTRG